MDRIGWAVTVTIIATTIATITARLAARSAARAAIADDHHVELADAMARRLTEP